jgi:hypothetical protein
LVFDNSNFDLVKRRDTVARQFRDLDTESKGDVSISDNILPLLLTTILFFLPFMLLMSSEKEQSFFPHYISPFIAIGIEFLVGLIVVIAKWPFLGQHAVKNELLPKVYKFFLPSLKIIGIFWFIGMFIYFALLKHKPPIHLYLGFLVYWIVLFIIKLPLPAERKDAKRWYRRNLGPLDPD